MHVDRKTCNLVIPLERAGGKKLYVHSTPVSREVYDRYWKVMGLAYTEVMGGPMRNIAHLVSMRALRDAAAELGMADEVVAGLVEEIRRLTNVSALTEAGWQTLPLAQAIAAKLLDDEEADEVENNVAFFTCFLHVSQRAIRDQMLDGLVKSLGAQISALNSWEHANSLRSSTEGEPSGPKAQPASIPV